jgi:hypothetical protein
MRVPKAVSLAAAFALVVSMAVHAEREFRVYPSFEADADVELPADYAVPGEFVVGRLMYPPYEWGRFGGGDWTQGGTSWAVDYPRGDRTFARLLRRLTRINTRSVEQPVNLDDGDDVFDWPFLIVGLPGTWDLTVGQAAKLREYLLRGGFLMTDDFHGSAEWANFMDSMRRVFPDRPVVEIEDADEVLHVLYDVDERIQVPGIAALRFGQTYERDGVTPHWRGIYDDHGRLMVAINFNMDLGDAWEHADTPFYPEPMTALAYRFAVNYVIYAMTH